MRSSREVLKEFSRKTGVSDPVIDQYFEALEETTLSVVDYFSRRTGIKDPVVDYFAGRLASQNIAGIHIDEAAPDSEARWQWIPITPDYHMHAAQRDRFENYNINSQAKYRLVSNETRELLPRGRAVMTGISAWGNSDEELDLVIIDEAKKITVSLHNSAEEGLAEALEAGLTFFRSGGMRGGFGICEPSRRSYRNHVDGDWQEAPKKLAPPNKAIAQASESSEDHESQE